MNAKSTVRIEAGPDQVDFWIPLLRRGVCVRATVNAAALDFLVGELKLDPGYVQTRVGSIFLDGRPVDDPAGATLTDGCCLALGMASPGLAGSCLNRCSPLAGFRSDISYHAGPGQDGPRPGTITLKLFNLVAVEAAANLMRRGFSLSGEAVSRAATADPMGFAASVRRILVGGQPQTPEQAAAIWDKAVLVEVVSLSA